MIYCCLLLRKNLLLAPKESM